MTELFRDIVYTGCEGLGVEIDEDRLDKLYTYYRMVIEKNKVMNLTAITDEKKFAVNHILDSLSMLKSVDLAGAAAREEGCRLIDVGTGAGFPGMVLKIMVPALEITLFDSLRKRLVFIDEAIEELKLDHVATLHGRAEDFGRIRTYREQYDYAVSRAVSNMATLSEYCLPFVKKNGYFVAYKALVAVEETQDAAYAIKLLGGEVENIDKFNIPGTNIDRSMVVVKKIKPTPIKYPRKAGTPLRDPLLLNRTTTT